MLKRIFTLLLIVISCSAAAAQSGTVSPNGLYIPKDLTEANAQLDQVLTVRAKAKFKALKESDFENISGIFLLSEWEEDKDRQPSRLVQYLNQYLVEKPEIWSFEASQMQQHLIYLSYLRHLHGQPFDLKREADKLNAKADSLQRLSDQQAARDLVADSINGIYIPRNLQDAFPQLDKLLSDTIKQQLQHPDPEFGLARFHFGLGRWLRNNWGLWGGSRLQTYMTGLGITHPDNMSGVILDAYSQYLNGVAVDEKAYKPRLVPQPVESDLVASPPEAPPTVRRRDHPKPYRQFLRKRRIDDFNSLPPEAYEER